MATIQPESYPTIPVAWTFGDLQVHLGGIPANRIRLRPAPGTATISDVLASPESNERICELLDGVLVEKTVGHFESLLAMLIGQALRTHLDEHDLGIVLGEAGTLRILPDQVRVPDVCFISWNKFPDRKLPREPVPAIVPDLAVEIISAGNTEGEMSRKLEDYFTAGVQLVWYVDAERRAAKVYSSPNQCLVLDETEHLDGGHVLPGFRLSIHGLFAKAGERSE